MRRAATALVVAAVYLAGHTFHRSYTEVNYNKAANRLEIICQIHADDLEMYLAQAQQRQIELDRTPDSEMLVAAYVMNQLSMRSATGSMAALEWIGMEIDRHFVTTYLELKLTPGTRPPASMKNTVLLANLPDQFNHVQLKRDGRPVSAPVLFLPDDEWKALCW